MKRRKFGCGTIALALIVVTAGAGYTYHRWTMYYGGIEATKEWARLNDFPESASGVTVDTRGGPFTREFNITFHAPLEDIRAWLDASPGTADVTPEGGAYSRRYKIEPGGGAAYAELEVNEETEVVKIQAFWS